MRARRCGRVEPCRHHHGWQWPLGHQPGLAATGRPPQGRRTGASEIVAAPPDLGIRWLTLYAFSTENWKRSTEEVLGLMSIFARYIEREADRLAAEGVRMRFIGDRTRLDPKLQRLMAGIEARTAAFDRLNLTVAINYGGRDEIVRAARAIAEDVRAQGGLTPSDVDRGCLCRAAGYRAICPTPIW